MGLGKRSHFAPSLEDSGTLNLKIGRSQSSEESNNYIFKGMMMGLGKRSPFSSSLEDSGKF